MSAWSSSAQQSNQHQFLFLISDLHSTLQTVFWESPKRESSSWVFNSHRFIIAFITNTVLIITTAVTTKALLTKALIAQVGAACHLFGFLPSLRQLLPLPTQFHTEGEQSIDLSASISPILIILDSYFSLFVSILSSSLQHRDPTMDFPEGGRWPIHVQVKLVNLVHLK